MLCLSCLPRYRIFLHGNICDVNGNKREYSDLNPVNVLHCLPVISSLTHTHWFIISTFCWSKRVDVQSGRLDWPDRTGAGSDCIEPYGEARGLVHVVTLTCLFLCSRHMTDLTCVCWTRWGYWVSTGSVLSECWAPTCTVTRWSLIILKTLGVSALADTRTLSLRNKAHHGW